MPKELIHGCLTPYGDDDPAIGVAEVRWGRDSEYVQLVTNCVHRADHEVYRSDPTAFRKAVDLSLAMHGPPGTSDGEAEALRKVELGQQFAVDIDPYKATPAERDWLLGYLVSQFGSGMTVMDGFYVTVDRRGINDLIRHLRRARDQAYGRDE